MFILPIYGKSQTGDAQNTVMDNINKALPIPIERFNPGGPAEEETVAPAAEDKPVVYFRRAKRMSAAFEGYAIEIALVDRPLLNDNPIFRHFGNIMFDRTADGKYSYMIMIPFGSKKSVDAFFENVIKKRNSEAKVIEYAQGKRKE